MQTLNLALGDHSYPIYIGQGLLSEASLLTKHIVGKRVVTVSNNTIAPLYLAKIEPHIATLNTSHHLLPDGEQYKTLEQVNEIFTHLLERQADRKTTLIALGGGVVGDMTGFAAASYQRGIHFIQVPTTLLAMVDSSVGGKTGVNHALGKNMIGAFHQPQCVIIDIDTLATLPNDELSAGLAEVIKYGLIRDREFLHWLDGNMERLMQRDADTLIEAIYRSCAHKAEVVAADEREAGERALLNLGHTFGHAIEAATGFGNWLHGEAVAAGMMMAAELSMRMGWLPVTDMTFIKNLLQRAHLPTQAPDTMREADFMRYMAVDKKVLNGSLRLVLLKALGEAVVTSDFDPQALQRVLSR